MVPHILVCCTGVLLYEKKLCKFIIISVLELEIACCEERSFGCYFGGIDPDLHLEFQNLVSLYRTGKDPHLKSWKVIASINNAGVNRLVA